MNMEEWLDLPELVDKVQELLELGLPEDAKALLDQYQQFFTEEWEMYFLYSRVFTDQNKPRIAISYLLKGLRLDRENVDCLLGLFYAHAMMNQIKRGGKFLLQAEKFHPDSELVLSALIWYYTEMNNPEKAVECFEKAKKAGSTNPETFRNGGLAYDRLSRFTEAENAYRAALQLSPGFEEVRDLLADHLIFTGQSNAAVKIYQDALKESPRNIRLMSKLVFCYSQNSQMEQAAAVAKESINLYPNSPIGYIDMAYVHLNSGDTDKALENAEKAIDVAPIDAEGYRVKGIAFSEQGKYDSAEQSFDKAIELDPQNSEILRDYYHHLRNAGKDEKMVDIVEKVVKIEYPYCTEDYWFLADFYREKNNNIKAFHFLLQAYRSMPAEKELIPPMIDILLEEGHTKYTLPIFISYVEKSGWNDTMNQFARNKRLKDRWIQEGIRFLRFTGQRPVEYRKFIFRYYLSRFALLFYSLIMISLLFPAGVLFGLWGIAGIVLVFLLSIGGLSLWRKKASKKKQSAVQRNIIKSV